jgi:hypothetical protein
VAIALFVLKVGDLCSYSLGPLLYRSDATELLDIEGAVELVDFALNLERSSCGLNESLIKSTIYFKSIKINPQSIFCILFFQLFLSKQTHPKRTPRKITEESSVRGLLKHQAKHFRIPMPGMPVFKNLSSIPRSILV